MRFPRTLQRALAAGVAAAACAIVPATAKAQPPVTLSGVYAGAANVSGVHSFASWRGAATPIVGDFTGDWSWTDLSDPSWLLKTLHPLAQEGTRLVICVPLLVQNAPGTFQAGAAGAYDRYFLSFARQLVSDGYPNAILRLGPEFNGSWEPYALEPSGPNSPAYFVAYWRHLVDLFRSVAGANFAFDWNVNLGLGTMPAAAAYPGDAYVDDVGIDVYDYSWYDDGGAVARWRAIADEQYGLNWWNNFAKAHGKPFSIPEWGVVTAGASAGGDDPYFIQKMYDWMSANQPAFEIYFDYGDSALGLASASQSASLYQRLYAQGEVQPKRALTSEGSSTTRRVRTHHHHHRRKHRRRRGSRRHRGHVRHHRSRTRRLASV